MDKKVVELMRKKQYAQRTSEWYKIRTALVTASSAASLLVKNKKTCESYVKEYGLEDIFDYNNRCCNPYSNKKQYFLDKCKQGTFKGNIATYWGQKYEPVVTDIYSKETNKNVLEFGLLIHEEFKFLGASPDGITEDGVMIEIKCPYRRKITGIPPFYYWIQVQLQMEVCDLEVCDFVEYEFVEFHTEQEFLDDDTLEADIHNKGLFIQVDKKTDRFIPCDPSESQYVYPEKQFIDNVEDLKKWAGIQLEKLPKMIDEKYSGYFFEFKVVYWKAVNKSIVRIKRDRQWFDNVKSDLQEGHDKILYYQKNDNYKELMVETPKNKKYVEGKTVELVLEEEKCVFNEDDN